LSDCLSIFKDCVKVNLSGFSFRNDVFCGSNNFFDILDTLFNVLGSEFMMRFTFFSSFIEDFLEFSKSVINISPVSFFGEFEDPFINVFNFIESFSAFTLQTASTFYPTNFFHHVKSIFFCGIGFFFLSGIV
jgi:hypothetical protein